ncbi:MAG TPA: 1-acyl-sn-glycerol-3-phosphate acyltransferase [Firmicutes bacterium]|nr:1-acyl-sn-glycerol-3-phosphate acyltransferase [Bacillota bacterium]
MYRLVHLLFSCYFKLAYRWQVYGLENIPSSGPFIICSNHISWFDPPLVACSIPPELPVHFMAKQELFSNFLFRAILKRMGAFPINRNGVDYTAIRTSFKLLAEGKIVCLFPEGTRSPTGAPQKAQPGAAMIAARSKVPVLPVAVTGPYRWRKPLRVNIGPLFYLPSLEGGDRKEVLSLLSAEIMDRIKALLIQE